MGAHKPTALFLYTDLKIFFFTKWRIMGAHKLTALFLYTDLKKAKSPSL
jgi:hypothetical protein